MRCKFIELLDGEIVLADGAVGTLLVNRGVNPNELPMQTLVNPDLVRGIHREYIEAGARIIQTYTFLANCMKLKEYGVEDRLAEINRAGVQLVREAAQESGVDVYIAGSVGPLGALVKPYGNLTLEDLAKVYLEQMEILVGEGVDLIIIETHPSLLEALEAIRAARTVSATTPVIAQMTFLEDGKSKFGDDLQRALEALAAADADVVGVNCSGPQMTFDLMEDFLRHTDMRVSIMANAGLPQLIGGRQIYLSSPEYLREYARRFAEAGANIIGGCCGTTPEHIRTMGDVIRGQVPRRVRDRMAAVVVVAKPKPAPEPGEPVPLQRRFREKLGQQRVVTVETVPPRGLDCDEVIEKCRKFVKLGVDAINVPDNAGARVRVSCCALAHLIQSHTGLETILHFTCRDRSLRHIQTELLGAGALGIGNILALTGEPSPAGEVPHVTSVFDVNATGLVRILHGLNHGYTVAGHDIGSPTEFQIGVTVDLAADDLEAEVAQFQERVEAGAHFAQTQPVYEAGLVDRFLQRVGTCPIPVIVSVLPLTSERHAAFLHHEVPGITIPEALRQRMSGADDPKAEGERIALELIENLQDEVAGIHLMVQGNDIDLVGKIMKGGDG